MWVSTRPTNTTVQQYIQDTPDLRRVVALERRTIDMAEAAEHARTLTRMLALTPGVALRPTQGQILYEAMTYGGAYAGAPVGLGKTLLNWLTPTVCDAKRAALIIPGGLRPDVQALFREYYLSWARPPGGITIVTLEELARVENEDLLFRLNPDLLIIDEVDTVRNVKAAATRRIGRYVGEREPKVCAWTGTPGRKSITDFGHALVWALKARAPVPLKRGELTFWGLAIDEATGFRSRARPDAGALERLGGGRTLEGVRAAFRARLHETPGVCIFDGDSCDQPLHIRQVLAPPAPALDPQWRTFRMKNLTPDGWPMSDAFSIFRHAGELGTEMYLRWNPRPPREWLEPRSEFCAFVREEVDAERGDTEAAVVRANPDADEVVNWLAVKGDFIPNSEPVWLGDGCLRACAEWLAASPEPSIVWTWTVAFGEALSTMTKLRYFGAGGYDRNGNHLTSLGGGKAGANVPSAILSGQANMRGRNLQAWTRHLGVNVPRSARYLEQWLGRPHRQGQDRPVHVDVMMTSGDSFNGFDAALREAEFGRAVFGTTQKLLRANIVYTDAPAGSPFRWRRGKPKGEQA